MGDITSGFGLSSTLVGSCEDGFIYRGSGLYRETIGSYRNGTVYRGGGFGGDAVGTYENGYVYAVPGYTGTGFSAETLGSYDGSTIYRGSGMFSQSVGSYSGDGAEAAALLLLLADHLPSYATDDVSIPGGGATSADTGTHSGGGTGGAGGGGSVSGGSGILGALLGAVGFLVLSASFFVIWYAIYQSVTDDPEDLRYLAIFLGALLLGLFTAVVVFKKRGFGELYVTTVIIASVINIAASALLDPRNITFFGLLIAPPLVTALAAAIPSALVCVGVFAVGKVRGRVKGR